MLENESGDYQPEAPIEFGPLYQWPPRPMAILKWVFGFPGYLAPLTLLFVGSAAATWLLLTPDPSRLRILSLDWIALIALRNLTLLVVLVSAWHIPLYVRKVQGTRYKYNRKWPEADSAVFFFRNQLWDNVFLSICSAVPTWTMYEVTMLWLQATNLAPTVSWDTHPLYCTFLLLVIIPFWLSIHFYTTHRFIHLKPLFRLVHSVHHKNVNTGPWSGLAMHPIEHLLYFSGVLLFAFVPAHPIHVLFALQILALSPMISHSGFGRLVLGDRCYNNDHYMHYLHHKYFKVNYGTELVPLDKWLGTFHDGSNRKRVREEALRNRKKSGSMQTEPQK
jgi:sterol desaturase/sphingolipid hydroxylase (fatty acid hydroxylase superfamily)